jgi:hypothetical protein
MKTKIKKLKFIEVIIYTLTFSIIFYDLILPENISDKIYNFGVYKITFISFAILLSSYFYIAKSEREYLKSKFNKTRLIGSFIVLVICIVLYFVFKNMTGNALESISN